MNTPRQRLAAYYSSLLSNNHFVKEIRLFNLGDTILDLLLQITSKIHETQRQQELRELKWQSSVNLFSKLIGSGAFIFIVLQAFVRRLSLGDVTLYTSAVSNVLTSLSNIVSSLSALNENALFYNHFTKLMTLPPDMSVVNQIQEVPPLTSGIELRNVSFRYTKTQPWVLCGVSLFIPVQQCVALVGLNGAGKTTLVKLLTRLYDPTEGQILWDGIDIQQFKPDDLRRRIGTIFQDFVRYDLTVRENIAFGDIRYINDEERIRQAASSSGIGDFINSLPQGYETVLSRWLGSEPDFGSYLSGGQWQKLALARMFMRDADFFILDEPTAALDPQAENEIYTHFSKLTASRTTLLISHRFSTVRMADKIAVLENGQIVEFGSHDELQSLGGSYCRLYTKQAARYGAAEQSDCNTKGDIL